MISVFGLGVGAVLAVVGALLLWYGFRSVDAGIGVFRTPAATIADAIASGEQSFVRGAATTPRNAEGESVVGPFSGQEALFVEYEVRELRYQDAARVRVGGRSNFQKSWQTIEEGRAGVPFEIDDETASALVDPTDADPVLGADQRTRVKGGRKPPEHIQRFIETSETVGSEERHFEVGPIKLRTGNDRRYVERRIEPGDEVSVFGVAETESGSVTDGRIDRGDPFVIADASKRRTVGRYLRGAALRLAFGTVFGLVGLAVVLLSF